MNDSIQLISTHTISQQIQEMIRHRKQLKEVKEIWFPAAVTGEIHNDKEAISQKILLLVEREGEYQKELERMETLLLKYHQVKEEQVASASFFLPPSSSLLLLASFAWLASRQ